METPPQGTEDWVKALVPIGVALVAAVISFLGLVIAKENKVSEFRQAWIDALRDDISRFVASLSLVSNAHAQLDSDDNSAMPEFYRDVGPHYVAMKSAATSIRLRVNRSDSNDELARLNGTLLDEMDQAIKQLDDNQYEASRNTARDLSQCAGDILKLEWKRVKKGEKFYFITKWVVLIVLTSVFVALLAIALMKV